MTRGRTRDQRGITAVSIALSMTALFTIIAFVIDLSLLRDDRRADQKIVDAAVSAGALQLAYTDGRDACNAALDYLEANTPGVSSFTGADCSGVPTFCDPSTPAVLVAGSSGSYDIEIVHPVPDDHWTMSRASALGAPTETVIAGVDGSNCDRLAVVMSLTRSPSFGGIVDSSDRTTRVHAVARANTLVAGNQPINLLILERDACDAITVQGGARVVVSPMVDEFGVEHPGILAVDSDGTDLSSCDGTTGTVVVDGSGSVLRADGPAGTCGTSELSGDDPYFGDGTDYPPGAGCGFIELLAAGVPGPSSPLYCEDGLYRPACDSTGTLRPHPFRMAERRTRAPIDHRFNCRSDEAFGGYTAFPWYSDQPIEECTDGTDNHIDDLFNFAESSGFQIYGDDGGVEPCTIEGNTDIVVPEGNWRVICSTLQVKRSMVFEGGNIVFDGDIDVTAQGSLTINQCAATDTCSSSLTYTAGGDFDENEYSNDAAWAVFRSGGGISKAGQGSLRIYETTVLLSEDAAAHANTSRAIAMGGGAGTLVWTAPTEGPFEPLALWSEATKQHDFAGQASLDMEGLFFAPRALIQYTGNGGQEQVRAQFISERLLVGGNGTLDVVPLTENGVLFESVPKTILLR